MFANKGYEEYFDSDGENGALIHNPQYEEIFKKLEKSVDNEIRNIPTYSKSMFENPWKWLFWNMFYYFSCFPLFDWN